ncbi:LysR family transcriptional regulator [Shewanella sp. NIFS-20-20]|uniref:LysR family transcriptional regulator n=1 Tax=Shewanella sp. NIFS-20-20 TaxID=2853806 RepID=UPI001C47CE3B|nr:LysR family transcriptional regulator [Shewanella sp. NIFS-20-20]MBV7317599.1 LysR family transcriptional regulator [Shewanella sp. NIFS-20-20]
MDIDDLKVGTLKVFKVVFEAGSTYKAAQILNQSQSGISYEIKKLREIFGDPLFLRCREGLVPNERASHIYKNLPKALAELENMYNCNGHFDPAEYQGIVKIAILEPLAVALMPVLYDRLSVACPHIQLDLMPWTSSSAELIAKGVIDVGIHIQPVENDYIGCDVLANSIRMIACRKHHPILNRKHVTLMEMCNYPLLLQSIPNWNHDGRSLIEKSCKSKGLSPNIQAKVSYLPAMVQMLQSSNALCYSSALGLASFRDVVELLPAPKELTTTDLAYQCLYPASQKKASFNMWLRSVIKTELDALMDDIKIM